ncbi:genetic interactor of prohibitins 3, mitochondrial [Acrasis kona]|uniref:Genetic interactor of prohibitins 3, mitochondrial n=1 Tax=Acrasis kona TaxID=1008807 RepID=A0AAW2YZ60_9EUKA
MSFKSHQSSADEVKRECKRISNDDGEDAKTKVIVTPWKPEGINADIQEFEIPGSCADQRVSLHTLILKDKFVLYTQDFGPVDFKYYLDKNVKKLFMVLKEDQSEFKKFIDEECKKRAKQSRIDFQNRSWKKQKIEHKNAKTYIQNRDQLEQIVDSWHFKNEKECEDEIDSNSAEFFVDDVREKSIEVLKEWSKFTEHFKDVKDQTQFVDDVERCVLPFKVKLDYYDCECLARIYSPIIQGNYIDTWMSHCFRTRMDSVDSMRCIVCCVGSLESDQSTSNIKKIKKKGEMVVNGTFVHDYVDFDDRRKGQIRDVTQWKKHLFGDLPLSDHRFALFLCAASGMMSVVDGDSQDPIDMLDQRSETGGVYNLILKKFKHDTNSEVEDAIEFSEPSDDEDEDMDSSDQDEYW